MISSRTGSRAALVLRSRRTATRRIKIVADFTKQPAADYSDWLFTKKDNYRDLNAMPNLKALQNNLKVQKQLGFLDIDIDVEKYADLSLVTDAAKRHH